MKKILYIVLLLVPFLSFSQKIDIGSPVITVEYQKTKSFYKDEVKKRIAVISTAYGGRKLSPEDVKVALDMMVDEELFLQEMDRLKIVIEPQELNKQMEKQKAMIGAKDVPDDEFRKMIKEKTGMTYDDIMSNIKFTLLQQKFIDTKYPDLLKSVKKPTNAEVEEFYNENINMFLMPLQVRYEQLLFPTQGKSTNEKKTAKDKAETFYKNIKAGGKVTFDKYVTDSLTDESYIGVSDIIMMTPENEAAMVELGQPFSEAIKKQKIGEFSKVIETKAGYHIIYITDRAKPKLLGLDDIDPNPRSNMKVRDAVSNMLMGKNQQKAFFEKLQAFVKEVRAKAKVTINEAVAKGL